MRRARSENGLLIAVLAGTLGAGCAAPYARRAAITPSAEVNQGGAWEVVFPGGETAAAQYAGPEASRRDWVLAAPAESDLPGNPWPEPYRPSLWEARRLTLPRRGEEILYLGREHRTPWPWRYHWWR